MMNEDKGEKRPIHTKTTNKKAAL